MIPIVFFPELMDDFFMAGVHQQPDQSNYLAEGQTLTCKLDTQIVPRTYLST